MSLGAFTRRAALLGAGGLLLAGCAGNPTSGSSSDTGDGTKPAKKNTPKVKAPAATPVVALTAAHGLEAMWPNEPLEISVTDGTAAALECVDSQGVSIPGKIVGGTWTPDRGALYPRQAYTLTITANDANGDPHTSTHTITTINPEMVTEVDFRFADGQVVGNGMPIWVRFDLPIPEENRAAIEKTAVVTTIPEQEGAWGWVDENTMQWRPRNYWLKDSTAHVEVHAAGLPTGDTWILNDAVGDYRYGDLRVLQTNIDAHTTACLRNGEIVNVLPVSTGKPGLETMTGTKMIMSHEPEVVMDSETFGVDNTSADGYRTTVQWAQRITWSGEYFHAAPWADYAHGNSNVSHGCTGMSDANAKWLFDFTLVGDPCEFTGSTFPVQPHQTWPAWVYSWEQWQQLSALV